MATAQDIEAMGLVRVDTGDPWLDLAHFAIVLALLVLAGVVYQRLRRAP